MSTRTVRLDDEAEQALRDVRKETGMSISEALKKGLLVLRRQVLQSESRTAWELYEAIDLGPGGYTKTPARDAKRAVRETIGRKHRK